MSKFEVKDKDNNRDDNKVVQMALTRSAMLAEHKHWLTRSKVDFEKPHQVEKRCLEYFTYVEENKTIPSYEGLAIALGINAKKLHQIEVYNVAGVATSNILSRYKAIIESYDYQLTLQGILGANTYALRAGFFSGIVSRTQIDLTPKEMESSDNLDSLLEELKNNKDVINPD